MTDHYSTEERRAHGRKLAKTRAAAEEALRVAGVMARSAHDEDLTETALAAEFGVNRMTIRRWLGKL